jgi:hypothetical protein
VLQQIIFAYCFLTPNPASGVLSGIYTAQHLNSALSEFSNGILKQAALLYVLDGIYTIQNTIN